MVGSRLHETLSMQSSTRHTRLWMSMTTSQTQRLLELLCISFDVSQNIFLTFPSAPVIVLFRKYLRWIASTFCAPTIQPSWRVGSLSQHQPWACYWCSCLVVRKTGCLPSPPSYGIGLPDNSGWVPSILISIIISLVVNKYFQLATLVDVEHVFSQGHLLLFHIRSCLSVQSTCALMCLGVWSLLSFVRHLDVKAVVVLPELRADEDEGELDIHWDRIL